MKWKAYVEGDEVDLAILRELFPSGSDPEFVQDNEGTYFRMSSLDGFAVMHGDEHRKVERLTTQINGVAAAQIPSFRPVRPTGRYTDDEGRTSHVVGVGSIEVRAHVSATGLVGGRSSTDAARPGPAELVALAGRDRAVAEVVELLAIHPLTWVDLYKIFEIVSHEAGGTQAVQKAGWSSRADLERFTVSANRSDVTGQDARHARNRGDPPVGKSMAIEEARDLIKAVARSWMGSLV